MKPLLGIIPGSQMKPLLGIIPGIIPPSE
jgi:hypothetical protein